MKVSFIHKSGTKIFVLIVKEQKVGDNIQINNENRLLTSTERQNNYNV